MWYNSKGYISVVKAYGELKVWVSVIYEIDNMVDSGEWWWWLILMDPYTYSKVIDYIKRLSIMRISALISY